VTASLDAPDLADRLMGLWSTPLPEDDGEAVRAFADVYTDPVELNGTATTLTDLVARARRTQAAYSDMHHHLLDRVEAPDRLVIAFRLRGTHTGPAPTTLGDVPATGLPVDVRVIDVLTLTEGRISGIVMVADELGLLHGLGAVALTTG
jgi:predicted ester cyclase